MTLDRRVLLAGMSAAALSGCARAGSSFDAAIERRFPPSGNFVETPSGRVHFDRRGRGPAVVLIHGASGNLRDFTFSFSDRLAAAGFTAIAMDRPGFGYSERPPNGAEDPSEQARILADAANALGYERPIVAGHSYGGAVAIAWLAEHPDRLSGAVSLAGITHPWPAGDNLWHGIASTDTLGPLVNRLVQRRAGRGIGEGSLGWVFRPQSPPRGYASHIGAELAARATSFRANAMDISSVNAAMARISAKYDRIERPLAIVHGAADRIVPVAAHAAPMTRQVPSAHVDILPGIGHMVHHVAVERSVNAIRIVAERAAQTA